MLTRFHREVVMPDMERAIDERVGGLRNEMLTHFDGIYQRFDRLETEYHSIVEGLRRLDNRMDALEKRMAALESGERNELEQLKAQILDLHDRLAIVEAQLQQQRAANAQLASQNPGS